MNWDTTLPVVFMGLMGLSMLLYVVLDGYDLGVGLLLHRATDDQKDTMIASIGPFWDANETWLVLGVGILLIAFPKAHGMVLGAVYLPVALMLVGLILRGVAFDFRVKAQAARKPLWLIMKTEGELQRHAVKWAKLAWAPVVIGMGLISLATPVVSETVRGKWFSMPEFIALLPIPLMTLAALVGARAMLNSHRVLGKSCWLPFMLTVSVFVLGAIGLAYSLFPYVVMDKLTIWQAASATEALAVIAIGCAITVPTILGYTVFSYRVFWGKATALRYA